MNKVENLFVTCLYYISMSRVEKNDSKNNTTLKALHILCNKIYRTC